MENQINNVAQEEAKEQVLALDVVETVEPLGAEEAKDFSAYAQEYGQKLTDAAGKAQEYLTERFQAAGAKIKELQEKDLSEVAEQAKDYTRKKPLQALAITAAAGFILGVIIRGAGRK
jgi:ElaB/YqjD/DUF883 family membrane-anchored ribosome-binding protein